MPHQKDYPKLREHKGTNYVPSLVYNQKKKNKQNPKMTV